MTLRELKDMVDILLVERQLGNKGDEDPKLVYYKNGKAISINNIYIPQNKMYGETVVALS